MKRLLTEIMALLQAPGLIFCLTIKKLVASKSNRARLVPCKWKFLVRNACGVQFNYYNNGINIHEK